MGLGGGIGIMEKNMETTGIIGIIAGNIRLLRDNGKDNGSYYHGLYRV